MRVETCVRRLAVGAALVSALARVGPALAGDIPGFPDAVEAFDSREVAMLPRYCAYTQLFREHTPGGADPSEIARWSTIIGPTFIHMHHYCFGLMKANRAQILARDHETRQRYMQFAIIEYDYVIDRSPADFVLLPEILTKKGDMLIGLGKSGPGITTLEHAIEIKPDYWPPYLSLSDYYVKSGERAKGRQLLEKAIAFAPEAKVLQTRLADLDKAGAKK